MNNNLKQTERHYVEEDSATKQAIMQKVLNYFVLSLLLASVGTIIGNSLDPDLYLPITVVELILFVAAFIVRSSEGLNRFLGIPILFCFAFATGLAIGPLINYYFVNGAGTTVLLAFATATITFTVIGFIGSRMKTDLGFLRSSLFAGLTILIIFGLITLLFPVSSFMSTVSAAGGTLLFSFYILFDFNQMMKQDITMDDVPLLALNLYLDFFNIFLFLLSLFDRD